MSAHSGQSLVLMLFLLMSPFMRLSAVAQGEAKVVPSWEDVRRTAFARIHQEFSRVKLEKVIAFYRKYAPDLLLEWERYCRDFPQTPEVFLRQLVVDYLEIESLREESPVEYERMLRVQRMESRIRGVGRELQRLAVELGGQTSLSRPQQFLEFNRKKGELQKLLQESFQETQQHQQLELNRLEVEMQQLQSRLQERAANQETILRERFRVLSGLEW